MKKEELTWEGIQEFLIKELGKTSHIMTFGTIGSRNIEHDIDTIITKKPNSSSAEFFKEIHTLFENLDSYLYKNFKTKVIRFAHSTEEFLVKGYTKDRSISFHTMIYVSFPEIKLDWEWALSKDESIIDILRSNYNTLYGKKEDIFRKDFQKEKKHENLFIYLYLYDFLNSNLPEKLLLEIMNKSFEYLYKKRLGLEAPIAKNREEIKKYFYKLCDILDNK
jgi:hypothetical protein